MQYLIGFFLIVLAILLVVALFISLLELLFVTLPAWGLGTAFMMLILIFIWIEKLNRLKSSEVLSRLAEIDFDGQKLNYSIRNSELKKYTNLGIGSFVSLIVGLLTIWFVLIKLYEKEVFKGLTFFDYKISEDVSRVFGYIVSAIIFIILITWPKPRMAVKNSIKKRIIKVLNEKKNQIDRLDELRSLENSINSIMSNLNIPSTVDFRTEIQEFINNNKTEITSNANEINRLIAIKIKQAKEEKLEFENVNNLYKETFLVYKEAGEEVKKAGSIFLIKELEFDYDGLNSDDLKSLLIGKKWNNLRDILNSIKDDLQRLKELATKYQEEGNEMEESEYEEETDDEKAYRILGIPQSATNNQIKKAYKTFASIWHPDTKTVKDHERIKEINWAYQHLKNMRKFT